MPEETRDPLVFHPAPAEVRALVTALLEPAVAVAALLLAQSLAGRPPDRPLFLLALLAFGLGFPGRDRWQRPPAQASLDLVLAWLGLLLMLALVGHATDSLSLFSPSVLVVWALGTPVLQAAALQLGRAQLARAARHPGAPRRVVVIGAGPLGVLVASRLASRRDTPTQVLGHFDDRDDDRLAPHALAPRLGALDAAAAYVRDQRVGEVHITLPLGARPRMMALLAQLQGTTASVFFVPDLTGVGVIQGRVQELAGLPVLGLCETPFTGVNRLLKRVADLVLASSILLLIAPLLLAVALGVRLSGPGPIVFRQRRNGLDGQEIVVYKFRSMRTQDDGAVVRQATRGDPRLTRFGAFIRRTSLDELPQFINVLQGRMSVVGPRPHAVAHNELYRPLVTAYMVRHKVKPGITGWAQVQGHRGETDTLEKMQARVACDLAYLRHWSLGLDLWIIARTVRLVLFDRQAY